jgi:hypothetical protein
MLWTYGADWFKWLKGGELFSSGSWVQENDREGGVSKPFPFGFRCRENFLLKHSQTCSKNSEVYRLRKLLECFGWFSDGFLDVLGFQWLLRMVFWSWPEDWLGPGSLRLAAQRGHHLPWTEGEFILDRDLRGKFSEQLGMVKTEAIN